jgi:hypothetical protein
VFWVPKDARWSHLKANAKRPEIGCGSGGIFVQREKFVLTQGESNYTT